MIQSTRKDHCSTPNIWCRINMLVCSISQNRAFRILHSCINPLESSDGTSSGAKGTNLNIEDELERCFYITP